MNVMEATAVLLMDTVKILLGAMAVPAAMVIQEMAGLAQISTNVVPVLHTATLMQSVLILSEVTHVPAAMDFMEMAPVIVMMLMSVK